MSQELDLDMEETEERLEDYARAFPYRATGLALGAGFILGGGLLTGLGGRLFAAAARITLAPLFIKALLGDEEAPEG